LLNYGKHIFCLPTSLESYKQWLEIGNILTQERDLAQSKLFTVGVPVLSPLRLTEMNAEILLGACANSFPVIPTVCPMAGTTGPYNLVGTLVLGNAENIFIAALSQMIAPGHPFLYLFGPSRTDMKSGADIYYTLDKVLWKLAAAQLGHSYNLPVGTECGGTMTYRYDQQNGAEGMLFMLAAYESGSAILSGIGSCYNANGMSAEMMVIQNAWLEAARFLNRGIDTAAVDQALESIARVGPGGHYLADDLTLKMLRTDEFFDNELFDHSESVGPHPSLLERAHQRVEELVAQFESPVPGKVREDLRRYFRNEYNRLG
jgi:trimethylamine--corrinoid protein Co-methyltransferase